MRACPHDNIALAPTFPGTDLLEDDFRGSVGSLNRSDYTALMMVVVFGAFANASGMIEPVNKAIDEVSLWIGASSPALVTALFILLCTFIVPSVLLYGAKTLSRTSNHIAWSIVPLGVAMWSAHLLFHFFTSYTSIVPVTVRALSSLGLTNAPKQLWAIPDSPTWLLQGELFLLVIGFLASIAICTGLTNTLKERLPWFFLNALLLVVGVWILLQPMQMRGMFA